MAVTHLLPGAAADHGAVLHAALSRMRQVTGLPETVKSYLRNAMTKLCTRSRMESVVAATLGGFLTSARDRVMDTGQTWSGSLT